MFSNIFSKINKVGDHEYILSSIQMQRVIQDLEKRVAKLESEATYVSDDYQMFMGKPHWVPLNTVVRIIANHLGLQMHYRPAQEQGFVSEFKQPQPTAAKGKK